MIDVESQLRNYLLDGVTADVQRAEQAYRLFKTIGLRADGINAEGFGELFGSLQEVLSEYHTLASVKIFEHPGRHRLRSIPGALKLLEAHAGAWKIPHRHVLHELLRSEALPEARLARMSRAELTQAVVEHYRSTLPSRERVAECNLSASFEQLRHSRDKAIAHNEVHDAEARERPTWGGANSLVEYAKGFLGTVGLGYLGIAYVMDDGEYLLDFDASRTSIALARLLTRAGILAPTE